MTARIDGFLLTVLATAALTACSAVKPVAPPIAPPAPPGAWEGSGVDTGAPDAGEPAGAAAEAAGWWTEFGDPVLDRLVRTALAGNHDVAAAAARLEAAIAQARIAGADLAPGVTASVDGARRQQNFIGLPIPGAGPVLSSTSTNLGASLNVSWEADLWGRLRAGAAAGSARASASSADLDASRLSLAGQTAKTWFAVLEAESQVELARETLASRTRTAEQIRRRFEGGLRTALDLRLALANDAAAAAALAGRQRALDSTQRQLQLLLGRYPSGELEAATRADAVLTLPELPPPPPPGLPADVLRRRPDLVAAEQRLAAAGYDTRSARAALYPSLRLTGSGGSASSELEDLLDSDFSVWSLAAGILQPVFQGGRLRAGVELNEARLREAAHGYSQRVLVAFSEVERALAAAGHLDDIHTALAESTRQAAAAQKLAEERYLAGLSNYLNVLEAQRQASQAKSQLLDVERQRLANRVDLHLALGGGDRPSPTQASLEP